MFVQDEKTEKHNNIVSLIDKSRIMLAIYMLDCYIDQCHDHLVLNVIVYGRTIILTK